MKVSARKLSANRKNARRSTGPQTEWGKLRSSGNARRHGLSIAEGATKDVKQLASEILEVVPTELRTSSISNWAHLIAEAEYDLRRARTAKSDVYGQMLLCNAGTESTLHFSTAAVFASGVKNLRRLERYERRALSRWRKASQYFRSHVKQQLRRAKVFERILG